MKNNLKSNACRENIVEIKATELSLLQRLDNEKEIHNWINIELLFDDSEAMHYDDVSCVLVFTQFFLKDNLESCQSWLEKYKHLEIQLIILSEEKIQKKELLPIFEKSIHLILPISIDVSTLNKIVDQVFTMNRLNKETMNLKSRLSLSDQDIHHLAKIGKLLGQERDFEKLIRLILIEFVKLVYADSGSIYVVEKNQETEQEAHLKFKSTYLDLDINEFLLPINGSSIAGHVALTGEPVFIDDAYKISKEAKYCFNDSLDKQYNYRTKSMMVVPIKQHDESIIGVIQLINRKKNLQDSITPENTKERVMSFNTKDYEFIEAMAGQAGIAMENNLLLHDIQNLFEGFVTASITAIEQRDITTSGHSARVANFTVKLAEVVDRSNRQPFRDITFSHEQIREIRYAGLLHDFGKVGVKEEVLLKAKKLYPDQLEVIKWRYYFFRERITREHFQKKILLMERSDSLTNTELEITDSERELNQKLQELDNMFYYILEANEPSVIAEGNFETLKKMMEYKAELHNGDITSLLHENEFLSLATRKGSLNKDERREIETHVSHTYTFLKQIPWTKDLSFVPEIAHGHHEKLDGTGYPLGLKASEICMQTRMMTISDIYDALTAPDRPYKPSLPRERALNIIQYEVEDQHIDPDLFDIFVQARVYENVNDNY